MKITYYVLFDTIDNCFLKRENRNTKYQFVFTVVKDEYEKTNYTDDEARFIVDYIRNDENSNCGENRYVTQRGTIDITNEQANRLYVVTKTDYVFKYLKAEYENQKSTIQA